MIDLYKISLLSFLLLVGCCHIQTRPEPMYNIFDQINDYRRSMGLRDLVVSENLNCAASIQAADMGFNRRCDELGVDGSTTEDRGYICDVSVTDQIISCGTTSIESTFHNWKTAETAQSLADPDLILVGCAMHNYYWVCTFSY